MKPGRPARCTLRFLLQTAVKFWWTNGNGEALQGEGRSRDVSEHGAFVFAPNCPPVGTRLLLTIDLDGIPDEIGPLPIEECSSPGHYSADHVQDRAPGGVAQGRRVLRPLAPFDRIGLDPRAGGVERSA